MDEIYTFDVELNNSWDSSDNLTITDITENVSNKSCDKEMDVDKNDNNQIVGDCAELKY